MEQIRPISKSIYKKAKLLKIKTITLQFDGGSDQGMLEVVFDKYETVRIDNPKFEKRVFDWAWEVYQYDGDSHGNCWDYSDDITYNLQTDLVSLKYQCIIEDRDVEFEPTIGKKKKT